MAFGLNQPPTLIRPPTVSGTRTEYRAKCDDALWLGSKDRHGSLLRLRERLRSIVMNMSVCLCVCLLYCPRGYLRDHTRDLYLFFVHVAYVRGSVLLRHVDDRPYRLSAARE